jgi:hypothetical protein
MASGHLHSSADLKPQLPVCCTIANHQTAVKTTQKHIHQIKDFPSLPDLVLNKKVHSGQGIGLHG